MKFAIAIIAGLALVASVHAAPSAENEVYISDSLRQIIAAVRGKLQVKIDELQKRREEIREQIRSASEEAKEELKKSLDKITNEVRNLVQQLLEVLKRGIRTNEESYFKDAIVAKIRDYREKAKEILQRVSEIVIREATVIGEEAKARFEEQKQILIDHVQRINDQIKKVVNDAINGKQEDPESAEYFIDFSGVKARAADLVNKMKELAAQAGKAVGAKKEELLEQLAEVREELFGAAKDVRNALREIVGKEPLTYGIQDVIADLRNQINEKVHQLKDLLEQMKTADGAEQFRILAAVESVKNEIRDLEEKLFKAVRDELNKPLE